MLLGTLWMPGRSLSFPCRSGRLGEPHKEQHRRPALAHALSTLQVSGSQLLSCGNQCACWGVISWPSDSPEFTSVVGFCLPSDTYSYI